MHSIFISVRMMIAGTDVFETKSVDLPTRLYVQSAAAEGRTVPEVLRMSAGVHCGKCMHAHIRHHVRTVCGRHV